MVLGSPTHFIVGSHTCTHLTCHSLPQLTLLLPLEDGQLWFCEAPSSRHHPGIEAHGPVSHQSEHWIPTWAGWRDTRAQSHGAERQINPGWQNTVEGFCLWVFFSALCAVSWCGFLVVVFSLFSVFLAVLCLVFGFSWKSLWHKPADKLQKKTMHFLEARQTQRGTHVPITRVATATRPRHLDQTGTHTQRGQHRRDTQISR